MKNLFSRFFGDEITRFAPEELAENRFFKALNKMNQYFRKDESNSQELIEREIATLKYDRRVSIKVFGDYLKMLHEALAWLTKDLTYLITIK
jgi:hypothetical protein